MLRLTNTPLQCNSHEPPRSPPPWFVFISFTFAPSRTGPIRTGPHHWRPIDTSMLHLERPLVFLDLEATGTDPQEARVIQIALQRFVPTADGAALDQQVDLLVNPETNIP